MKFRAIMLDAAPMREFSSIVTTISKLSKESIIRLSEDEIYFIVSDENNGPAPPMLWCEIPRITFFSEYQIVGLDDEHKDIYLSINSGNLARSLSMLKSAKSLKLKLTKKQYPCLTLEIETPSSTSLQTRNVTHDIPISIIPWKQWNDFEEPKLPNPDISISLPPLKQVRSSVERMRTLSPELTLKASAAGRLTLQTVTDMARISTRYKDLIVHAFEGPIDHSESDTESEKHEDITQICKCRVDAKKLSMFLSAENISHSDTLCSIINNKLVILSLNTEENVKLQCFISGIIY